MSFCPSSGWSINEGKPNCLVAGRPGTSAQKRNDNRSDREIAVERQATL